MASTLRQMVFMQRHRFLLAFFFVVSSVPPAQAQQILAVVSSANSQPLISPNSLATIYGSNLAQGTASAPPSAAKALPTALAGASVSIGGETAPLLYVSPQQIDFLVPANTPIGAATVIVKLLNSEQSTDGNASVALVAPGLFTVPCLRPSRGAVLNGVTYSLEPFQTVTSQNPAPARRTACESVQFVGFGRRSNASNRSPRSEQHQLYGHNQTGAVYRQPADFRKHGSLRKFQRAARCPSAGLVALTFRRGGAGA